MAEKTGELKSLEKLDPVSTAAGTSGDQSLDIYPTSDERDWEMKRGEAPEETEQIKAKIEATRHQMGETIDAIQERLSFANISEQVSETVSNAIESAKDSAYDATIGKAVNLMKNVGDGVTHSGAFKTVRSNPLPFALIGVGAGLLAYQGLRRRGNGGDHSRTQFRDDAYGERSKFSTTKESITGAASKAYGEVTDKASSAIESVSHVAEKAREGVTGVVSGAREGVTGAVNSAYEGANELAHRAYDRAGEYGTLAHEKYDQVLEENPLALGAVAIALGAAVGFAIPSTRQEGKLMGDARENLLNRVQDAAGSLAQKAKTAATGAGHQITSGH